MRTGFGTEEWVETRVRCNRGSTATGSAAKLGIHPKARNNSAVHPLQSHGAHNASLDVRPDAHPQGSSRRVGGALEVKRESKRPRLGSVEEPNLETPAHLVDTAEAVPDCDTHPPTPAQHPESARPRSPELTFRGNDPASGDVRPRAVEQPVEGPSAAIEVRLAKAVKRLRSVLHRQCSKRKTRPPLLCIERWLFRTSLPAAPSSRSSALAADAGASPPSTDRGIPHAATLPNPGLCRDLAKSGLSPAQADEIAAKLAAVAGEEAEALRELEPTRPKVFVVWIRGEARLSVEPSGRPYVRCTEECYRKLSGLWDTAHPDPDPSQTRVQREDAIAHDIYCVLARYDTIAGEGYQAALPIKPFEFLQNRLGVSCECFASPLNCTLPAYHSAFPTTDTPFGTRGSIFDAPLTEGSYEANPPFVPETMSAMATRMEAALDTATAAGAALSFAVFVPEWPSVRAWGQLSGSAHLVGSFTVPAADHAYVDGAQHRSTERHRPSSFGTGVFFLQSPAGQRRWPVDNDLVAALKAAMVATAGDLGDAKTIAQWEARVHRPAGRASRGRGGKGGGAGRGVGVTDSKDALRAAWAALDEAGKAEYRGSWRAFSKAHANSNALAARAK